MRATQFHRVLQAALLATAACAAAVSAGDRATSPEMDPALRARLERIVRTRGFTRGVPRDAMPAPDGRRVYFLQSGPLDPYQVLAAVDVATGRVRPLADLGAAAPGGISSEEQARRERQRQTERGVTSFELSDDGALVLVPYSGDLYTVDARRGGSRRVTSTPEPEIDPHLSPDGRWVSFLRGNDLVGLELATGREITLAHSDDPNVAWGAAEFIAQEEMDRRTGHWWSPDSRSIVFTRVDVSGVPTFRVPDFDDPTGEGSAVPYPKAGDPNASVSLHVLRIGDAGGARRLDLGGDVEYLARVHWAPGSDAVWVETQPRRQNRVDVRRIDLATGAVRVVLREEDRDWVNLHDDFRLLKGESRFVWSSERSGHKHLEIVDATTGERRPITSGDWDVGKVVDVDERRGTVTFTGTRDGLTEQHLYRVGIGGGRVERLTREPGWHEATFHPLGHEVFVETWSDDREPTQVRVRRRGGEVLARIPSAALAPNASELEPPARFLALDVPGVPPLDVRLVLPPRPPGGGRLPLVVYVYSGPGAQQVKRAWPGERGFVDLWLASQGFAVVRIDGRGIGPRGHDSERIFAGRLGKYEIADQVAGVRALLAQFPEIDPQRVGIWGWSYGGYATLMALENASTTFRVGVSVAPVVDWHGYDTHYTERYLGLPSENSAGYDSSSALTHAGALGGYLVLVHGTTDDNVHFRESMLLAREFQRLGKRFDLMVYPGTHMMETFEERMHLYELVWRTFAEHL